MIKQNTKLSDISWVGPLKQLFDNIYYKKNYNLFNECAGECGGPCDCEESGQPTICPSGDDT